jgi:hypothetical protein
MRRADKTSRDAVIWYKNRLDFEGEEREVRGRYIRIVVLWQRVVMDDGK